MLIEGKFLNSKVMFWENNSYISSYDDGDSFGYDIPAAMEAKLEGLMQLDWDKDSSNADVTPYVQMISQLTEAMQPRMAKMNPKLASSIQTMLKSSMAGSTAELSSLVTINSASIATSSGGPPFFLRFCRFSMWIHLEI